MEKSKTGEKPVKRPNVKGEDYYFENGYLVFTEKYLRERGHCCESGCRHCPYGFKKKAQVGFSGLLGGTNFL